MRLRRILALAAVVAAILGYAASAAAPAASAAAAPATGWVRCANLSPDSQAVETYLLPFGHPRNPLPPRHVSYGDVSSYRAVAAGQYSVAFRPVGASASSPPLVSVNFMVSAGMNYTLVSVGPATARRVEVLKDQMAVPSGSALVRVIQASLKQHQVTVTYGPNVLAQQLASGTATSYMSVPPGTQTVAFSSAGEQAQKPVTLAAGSAHTIVVLDTPSGLSVDTLTDTPPSSHAPLSSHTPPSSHTPAGRSHTPIGGAATGFGGMAPHAAPGSAPWLATLAAGLLLLAAGVLGLRRSRRNAAALRG